MSRLGLWIGVGMGIGVAFGVALGNVGLGVAFGPVIGVLICVAESASRGPSGPDDDLAAGGGRDVPNDDNRDD